MVKFLLRLDVWEILLIVFTLSTMVFYVVEQKMRKNKFVFVPAWVTFVDLILLICIKNTEFTNFVSNLFILMTVFAHELLTPYILLCNFWASLVDEIQLVKNKEEKINCKNIITIWLPLFISLLICAYCVIVGAGIGLLEFVRFVLMSL